MTNSHNSTHSIQDAAQLSGLPATTLRYYEDIGLLGPIARDSSSGHRRYSEADIELALAVACLSAAGMAVHEMRAYLDNRQHGLAAAQEQLRLMELQQRRLRQQARDLRLQQSYIDAKVDFWRARLSGDEGAVATASDKVHAIAAQLHARRAHLQPETKRGSDT